MSFERTFQITVSNVDLDTGFRILKEIQGLFWVNSVQIKERGGRNCLVKMWLKT